ncbi:Required for respiratory growth protein 9 [Penicillium hispanicum]|uniref:Required for respiratory growth protein 9 n=1 Tax=Penicillium hispanicum TaxID=1080232 RepID=UPI002541B905|nr:Required for respiratory growth protein 9 [Penicillium hispanicum]KAJ5569422.1 Required for respiratory growth protein 9 [Penicillium hispanicum]
MHCAASARLALPSVLRGIIRTELAGDLRTSPVRSSVGIPRKLQYPRLFSSTPLYCHNRPIETPNPHASHSSESSPQRTSTDAESISSPEAAATSSVNQEKSSSRGAKEIEDPKRSRKENHSPNSKQVPKKKKKKPEFWQIQKDSLNRKFPAGWNPPKKLSPDALEGIRHLHATAPEQFTTAVLAEEFKVSPEAIRRILKSKWRPSASEAEDRRKRWEKRHERIWSQMAELGLRPSTKRSRPLSDANALYRDDEKL